MREILFKAKRVDNGEWVEVYYIKATHHWHEHGKHEDWIAVDTIQNGGWCNVRGKYAIIPETLCQFTGLHDKNGKRIWENDIVRELDYMPRVAVVKFGKGYYDGGIYPFVGWYYQYSNDDDIDGQALYESVAREGFEVIGNSIDNPELLTAERIDENEN